MAHIVEWSEFTWDSMYWGQLVPDHWPEWKRRYNMGDFVPRPRGDYRAWLLNLKTQSVTQGPAIGADAPDVTALQATCAAQITRIDDTDAAAAALQSKQEAEADGRRMTDAALREQIGDWKRLDGWTPEAAAALQAISTTPAFDPSTFKPEFKVRIIGGEIRLDWKKKGADGVFVYCRLRGQTTWIKLAMDTSSPYIDGRPLAQAGVAEVREYMLRGVVNDEAIGLDSDILSIAWEGQ